MLLYEYLNFVHDPFSLWSKIINIKEYVMKYTRYLIIVNYHVLFFSNVWRFQFCFLFDLEFLDFWIFLLVCFFLWVLPAGCSSQCSPSCVFHFVFFVSTTFSFVSFVFWFFFFVSSLVNFLFCVTSLCSLRSVCSSLCSVVVCFFLCSLFCVCVPCVLCFLFFLLRVLCFLCVLLFPCRSSLWSLFSVYSFLCSLFFSELSDKSKRRGSQNVRKSDTGIFENCQVEKFKRRKVGKTGQLGKMESCKVGKTESPEFRSSESWKATI